MKNIKELLFDNYSDEILENIPEFGINESFLTNNLLKMNFIYFWKVLIKNNTLAQLASHNFIQSERTSKFPLLLLFESIWVENLARKQTKTTLQ